MRIVVLLFLGIIMSATSAQASNRDIIVNSCLSELEMTGSQCNCVADNAEKSFNKKQMVFFLAAISADPNKRMAAMSNMTMQEMTRVAELMEEIPQKCGG